MTETAPRPQDLQHLEGVAALGYLLNAIAHDLNNLLTNLMLGADQVQYGGGAEAVELLVEQVQRVTGITRSIQKLGQRNMSVDFEVAPLDAVISDFAQWHRATWPDVEIIADVEAGLLAKLNKRHTVHALSLLAWATGEHHSAEGLHVSLALEDVPRSAWAGSTDTIPMAVVRIRRGAPGVAPSQDFKRMVDGFFEADRTASEVAMMAAWEVVRKLRGRMRVRGGADAGGMEVTLELPLSEAT
jgi:hypothetical protein